MATVTLGLVQMKMEVDKKKNLAKALRMIEEAAKGGAQIVCLAELFTTPYFCTQEHAPVQSLAEPIPGPTTKALSDAAKRYGITLIGGSLYEKEKDAYYNTAAVFNEMGELVGVYRKIHIPHDTAFYERNYFSPGNKGYCIIKTTHATIGVLICYDQWFPEAARIATLQGAQMLFYPTAIGTVKGIKQTEGSWQEAWEHVQRGHAIANGVAVCAVNRVGKEGDSTFWGGSFLIDQFGKTLTRADSKERVLLVKADLELGREVQESWRFLISRRPETYKRLLQ